MAVMNNQDVLLETLSSQKVPVSVYLVNGIRLQGIIEAQDRYTLLLKNDGISQLIYKHAVTTILPSRSLAEFKEKEAAMA